MSRYNYYFYFVFIIIAHECITFSIFSNSSEGEFALTRQKERKMWNYEVYWAPDLLSLSSQEFQYRHILSSANFIRPYYYTYSCILLLLLLQSKSKGLNNICRVNFISLTVWASDPGGIFQSASTVNAVDTMKINDKR